MGAYNVVPIAEVADASEELTSLCVQLGVEHVTDPAHMQIRFLREPLGLENFAVSLEQFAAGFCPSRGHRHKLQEEVYLLISGQAEIKLEDEVVALEPMTAVRVPPETGRALRARGAEDAVVVTIGAPQTSMDDVEFIPDFWRD
jgi:uncharacterized cupin superfamily protein